MLFVLIRRTDMLAESCYVRVVVPPCVCFSHKVWLSPGARGMPFEKWYDRAKGKWEDILHETPCGMTEATLV